MFRIRPPRRSDLATAHVRSGANQHHLTLISGLLALTMVGAALLAACQPTPPASPTAAQAKPTGGPAASPEAPAKPAASPAASPSASPVASPAPAASPTALRVIDIDANDFTFQQPDSIAGGLVHIRMRNLGSEPHHAQFMRLNTNVTLEQFLAALMQGPEAALQLASLEGGPATVDRAGTAEAILDLKEGQYVLACFIESPDGFPHIAKGMVKPLRVTAPPPSAISPPSSIGTIVMRDFAYDLPGTLPIGRNVLRVVNEGPQPHEAVLARLAPGKTLPDLVLFLVGPPAGPPPFELVGGMQGLGRSGSAWAPMQLQAGEYAVVCLIPDPASGKSHLELGMARTLTVR